MAAASGRNQLDESALVFNVVWTGEVFEHLQRLVASQLSWSRASFRFIANACPSDQLDAMERFADDHPGRVVEVFEVSRDRMIRHGDALDEVFRARDDGPCFSFVDADILARGPFLEQFCRALQTVDAVTSGREVWAEHNIRPADHPGVSGEYFFDQDGFVFGSPHFAIYHRRPLADTRDRWNVGFSSAGADLSDAARTRLEEFGRSYWIYDTAKVINILLQADGHTLTHEESPQLVHFGGVSHFLAPPSTAPAARGLPPAWGEGPDWGTQVGQARRYAMASYTADVLRALNTGRPVPSTPDDAPPAMGARLEAARRELEQLFTATGGLRSEPKELR